MLRNETDCLVFIEVKTRSSEEWGRPASAIECRAPPAVDPRGA